MWVAWMMAYLMKSISYAHVMHHIRVIAPKAIEFEKENKDPVTSIGEDQLSKEVKVADLIDLKNWEIIRKHKSDLSQLVNLKDFLYFIMAPTFCYQLYYPRNPDIRWGWVFKRCVEFLGCIMLMM
jgi:hypothetical protein